MKRNLSMTGITVTVGVRVGVQDSYISKRDKEFVGPDERLELLLKRRMTPPPSVVGDLRALENSLGAKPKPYLPPGGARREITFHEYNGEHLKVRILQFQQYLIHLTRGYVVEIEPLLEKYQDDERVRVAYTFGKLEQWLQKIRTLYKATLLERYRKNTHKEPSPRPILIIYFYYQHMLRIHVDITYTIEFITYIHDKYISVMKTLNVSSAFKEQAELNPAETYSDVLEKLKGRNISDEDMKQMMEAGHAGLKVTLPPL
ncbi:unnamed protein product [Arctia plantaginis]|uniref:Uncharacterized protein n=1 Tax=Arctia plantaginis TaxID=874455 RepID=A0A8S0YU07_ARCPL|nr:unnamed protein product [Arctia plantaginis]